MSAISAFTCAKDALGERSERLSNSNRRCSSTGSHQSAAIEGTAAAKRAKSLQRILDDDALCRELTLFVVHVLQLAAAAFVTRVVRTRRIDSHRRWSDDVTELAASKATLRADVGDDDIPGRSTGSENDKS